VGGVSNSMDGISVACHIDLQWVHLVYFDMDEIASCVWQFHEIKSSSSRRVAHCQDATVYEVFDLRG
jgi:hypothetical protein